MFIQTNFSVQLLIKIAISLLACLEILLLPNKATCEDWEADEQFRKNWFVFREKLKDLIFYE